MNECSKKSWTHLAWQPFFGRAPAFPLSIGGLLPSGKLRSNTASTEHLLALSQLLYPNCNAPKEGSLVLQAAASLRT